ncbi:hypothetical protein C8F01DRAFT_443079 [Mycena amicta]|nr:hypothetical protein C8F01DRAFT_443079 [Mycena amicta]
MDTLRTWAESPSLNYPDRFHVLVVGVKGVGKSCLLRHTLGLEHQISPHSTAGDDWDLAPGVSSPRNPRFVMHELGYVPNPDDSEGIAKIRRFFEAKTRQPFEHQIHAIWFCVEIPFIDSLSVFTPLELEFLISLDTKIPVIVIFTQFDGLVSRLDEELSLPDTEDVEEQLTLRRALVKFERSCLEPLSQITPILPYVRTSGLNEEELDAESQQSLNTLLQTTCYLTEEYIEWKLRRSSTIPDLASVSDKLDNSIQIAMKVYYRTVFSDFWGRRLEDILAKLHRDTTRTWNLDDPMVRRDSLQFVSEVQRISSVPTLSDYSKMSWPNLLDRYQILISLLLGTTISVSLGRVALALAMCLWFAYIFSRMQQQLPETLRSFLEYSIHLTLLLGRILHNALTSPHTGRPHPLTEADIMRALGEYQGSEAAAQVHSEVQLFVDDACESPLRMWRGLRRGRAEELVRELVQRWRAGVENV